jgi:hypothetical protein
VTSSGITGGSCSTRPDDCGQRAQPCDTAVHEGSPAVLARRARATAYFGEQLRAVPTALFPSGPSDSGSPLLWRERPLACTGLTSPALYAAAKYLRTSTGMSIPALILAAFTALLPRSPSGYVPARSPVDRDRARIFAAAGLR